MGWRPKTSLEDGLQKVYAWYLEAQGRTIQPLFIPSGPLHDGADPGGAIDRRS
jgi:hypothetical protein